jgi:hypothetical protein
MYRPVFGTQQIANKSCHAVANSVWTPEDAAAAVLHLLILSRLRQRGVITLLDTAKSRVCSPMYSVYPATFQLINRMKDVTYEYR